MIQHKVIQAMPHTHTVNRTEVLTASFSQINAVVHNAMFVMMV